MRSVTKILLLVSALTVVNAQDTGPTVTVIPASEGKLTLSFAAEGTEFPELLKAWNEVTGISFLYSEGVFRGSKFHGQGKVTLPMGQLDRFLQTLLVHHGFALIPTGTPDARAFTVERIDHSRQLRQRAKRVPASEIPALVDRPAEVFMTSIMLEHVPAAQVRQAINQVLGNRNAEFVHEVAGSNSVLIVAFGPTLAHIHALLQELDKPSPLKVSEQPEKGSRK